MTSVPGKILAGCLVCLTLGVSLTLGRRCAAQDVNQSEEAVGDSRTTPTGIRLVPVSEMDGPFETIQEGGKDVYRGLRQANGEFGKYMYFRSPESLVAQQPVIVEVVFRDAGQGRLELQYNSAQKGDYHAAEIGYGRLMVGEAKQRTAVFQLAEPSFRQSESSTADLRLMNPDTKVPLQIVSVTLHLHPTPLFEYYHLRPWLKPYTGPVAQQNVDATTLQKKVLCGYQGWFRARGDDAEEGWKHWSRDPNRVAAGTLTVEMWPDLSEFTDDEKFPVPGMTYPDGQQAALFSSLHPKTVERHFEWMAKHEIDGVLVQRFVSGLSKRVEESQVLGHARASANRTGRVFAVEYDMSGVPADRLYDRLVTDWKWLVDEMQITSDPRYLHHEGKPVLGVWGFYSDRFDGNLANRIIDFFQNDPKYRVCLIGGCQWYWRKEANPEWVRAFRRFDVISPWNVGNTTKDGNQIHANTGYWADDIAEANKSHMLYLPVIYPGFSWDNLKRKRAGRTGITRLGGEFYWRQFSTAADLGLEMAKVAMFDEVDEATAIFKVSNTPPVQGHFVTFEGKPSDWYLRLTGEGTKLLRKQRPNSSNVPIDP